MMPVSGVSNWLETLRAIIKINEIIGSVCYAITTSKRKVHSNIKDKVTSHNAVFLDHW